MKEINKTTRSYLTAIGFLNDQIASLNRDRKKVDNKFIERFKNIDESEVGYLRINQNSDCKKNYDDNNIIKLDKKLEYIRLERIEWDHLHNVFNKICDRIETNLEDIIHEFTP
jgi:hypothetical protein